MLLTELGCEELQPVRQRLVHPYQPWRYVAITAEAPCFLIERGRLDQGAASLLSAYLVASPEQLLQIVEFLGHDCRVYKVHLSGSTGSPSQLDPLKALYSYATGGPQWFSYQTQGGAIHPCLPWQPKAEISADWTIEWMASQRSLRRSSRRNPT